MKGNTLLDVHNMMVEELENLLDLDLGSDDAKVIESEMKRAEKVAKIGHAIAANANAAIKGAKATADTGAVLPPALTMSDPTSGG